MTKNPSEINNQSPANGGDIGARLLEKKVISEDQLQVAIKEQIRIKNQKTIGAILVEMGVISEGALGEILNEHSGIKTFDIKSSIIDPRLVKKIPKEFAVRNKMIPISYSKNEIVIATPDVFDIVAIDQAKRFFPPHFTIVPTYASETDIIQAIDQYYDYEMSIGGILREIESGSATVDETQLRGDYKSPMVRLVDSILTDAVHRGASDIHFEPESLFLRIRYRIDGKMMQIRSIHKDYWASIAVRIKIMSSMNIAENRRPQDGKINTEILGRKIDFRVSTQPTINGENIVMRILDEKKSILSLESLGFNAYGVNLLTKLVKRPEGVVIMTGPTGSGKTTTLYTLLNQINSIDKNIMTLEDPVEYNIPLVRQSNIKSDIPGMDFASGIRALLRQDPDVILVGEIRDKDTAVTAFQAAMTGHQVYSSLHTNDSLGVIPRLMTMGVPSYLMGGSIICVIAQRLARKICSNCKIEEPIKTNELRMLGEKYHNVKTLFRGKGCEKCDESGYKGRVVIAEILPFDRDLDELVVEEASRKEMYSHIIKKGFIPMIEDGIEKVVQGLTDLKELMRVVDMTDRLD
ncbi:MAG: type secretory pathway, ATPase PulE/Tfp pilus assembly pathway, ATPase PilB [Rickettsiaceae bacterium]|jgi:type II secretory ATPase GspE/PulE/Tfp pilus assembly ATPase PilB-like protein|nr:type secretory pathway, ATPase PulE/Tfp pilus assembly pathway, ATPase PilB [Rickettsiaceae bacterium]